MRSICKIILIILLNFGFLLNLKALTIKPTIVEITASPKETISGVYSIKNDSGNPVTISVEPETFYGAGINKWLKLEPGLFTLQPGEEKKVKYNVNLPEDFKDEYSAKIFFTQNPVTDTAVGAAIVTRLGSSFYVSALGKEIISTEIKYFSIHNSQDLKLSVTMINDGNVHLRFFYDLVFFKDGVQVHKTDKKPLTVIIPGRDRSVDLPLPLKKILLPGKYQAVINLYYGNIKPYENKLSGMTDFEVKE
ncbi:MAG: hypothetical protein JW827_11680 [Spirochaetes bacterium]|nr:hypothetical protein [Spirochaetota bacterium]